MVDSEVDPYLPDIMRDVAGRVNDYFENRDDDPFSVYYDHGLYEQVGNDRIKSEKGYLFIWLVMPFTETTPADDSYFADASCKVLIATSTDPNYTQQQREDININPRLLPVFKQLIRELRKELRLDNSSMLMPARRIIPYWGGGEPGGPGEPNLWKDNVDGIEIPNLKLKIGHTIGCTFSSNL